MDIIGILSSVITGIVASFVVGSLFYVQQTRRDLIAQFNLFRNDWLRYLVDLHKQLNHLTDKNGKLDNFDSVQLFEFLYLEMHRAPSINLSYEFLSTKDFQYFLAFESILLDYASNFGDLAYQEAELDKEDAFKKIKTLRTKVHDTHAHIISDINTPELPNVIRIFVKMFSKSGRIKLK